MVLTMQFLTDRHPSLDQCFQSNGGLGFSDDSKLSFEKYKDDHISIRCFGFCHWQLKFWSSDFIICKKRLDNGKDQGAWTRSEMTIMIKLTTNYPLSFKRQSAEDRQRDWLFTSPLSAVKRLITRNGKIRKLFVEKEQSQCLIRRTYHDDKRHNNLHFH